MHFHLGFHTTDAADMTADKLFNDERTLYLPYSDALAALITDTFNDGFAAPVSSGVLLLRDSVSAARRTEIRAALEEYAEVTMMEALLESTRAYVGASLRKLLPMPLFLLAVTSLAYISVAVLGLYRRRADFTIYAMEGCTKRRMLLLAAAQAALPLLFTDAAVAAVVLILQKQAESGAFAAAGRPVRLAEPRLDGRRFPAAARNRRRHRRLYHRPLFTRRGAAAQQRINARGPERKQQ